MSLLDKIPGYREALEKESQARELPYIFLDTELCGFRVMEMTALHFVLLVNIKSPFVTGGIIHPAHISQFLWVMSPLFSLYKERKFLKRWHTARTGKLIYEKAVKEIKDFVSEAFQDSPGGRGKTESSAASFCAYLVHLLASKYGWDEDRIMRMPLKKVFQYVKIIHLESDPKAIVFNPSDRIKSKYLEDLNRGGLNG
jgi:hypothetical protein